MNTLKRMIALIGALVIMCTGLTAAFAEPDTDTQVPYDVDQSLMSFGDEPEEEAPTVTETETAQPKKAAAQSKKAPAVEQKIIVNFVIDSSAAWADGTPVNRISRTLTPSGEARSVPEVIPPEGKRLVKWDGTVFGNNVSLNADTDSIAYSDFVQYVGTEDEVDIFLKPVYEDVVKPEPVYTIHVSFKGYDTYNGTVTSQNRDKELDVHGATAPEGQKFAGWVAQAHNHSVYEGKFNFEELSKLVGDNWTVDTHENWLTFEPYFVDEEEPVYTIHVSFEGYDTNNGIVTSKDPETELKVYGATAPEGKEFIGWKALVGNQPIYEGKFNFEELSKLVGDNWTVDTHENWLTFEPYFVDEEEPVYTIHVRFEGYDTNNGDVTSVEPAIELNVHDPIVEGKEFVGWKALVGAQPMYEGAFNFAELSKLVGDNWTVDTHENWLTFEPVFKDKEEPIVKTLKIFWAIDNTDGAQWADREDGDPWTETIAWSDKDNTFVMPKLNVKEGYELAGWSVSGTEGNYWDAATTTFGLTGLIVEDEEGGYVAITANVVVKDTPAPETYTVTYTDGVEDEEVFADQVTRDLLAGAETPAFEGELSRKGYVFAGWLPEVAEKVSANAVYTATWKLDTNNNGIADDEEPRYTVTYTDGVSSYTVFKDQVYSDLLAGTATPAFVGTPKRSGYTFEGWKPAVSETVTKDVVYEATWKQVTEDDEVPKTMDNLYPMQMAFLIAGAVFLSIAAFSGVKYRKLRKSR